MKHVDLRKERNPVTKDNSDCGRTMWQLQERDSFQMTRISSHPWESQVSKFSNVNVCLRTSTFLQTKQWFTHRSARTWYLVIWPYGRLIKYWKAKHHIVLTCPSRIPKWPLHPSGTIGHGLVKQGDAWGLSVVPWSCQAHSYLRPLALDILSAYKALPLNICVARSFTSLSSLCSRPSTNTLYKNNSTLYLVTLYCLPCFIHGTYRLPTYYICLFIF